MRIILCIALFCLLVACERLDPLTVIDNPYGKGSIVDISGNNNDRIICVLEQDTQLCDRSNADVIVSGASLNDIILGWSSKASVTISVKQGSVLKSREVARGGKVIIDVRRGD